VCRSYRYPGTTEFVLLVAAAPRTCLVGSIANPWAEAQLVRLATLAILVVEAKRLAGCAQLRVLAARGRPHEADDGKPGHSRAAWWIGCPEVRPRPQY